MSSRANTSQTSNQQHTNTYGLTPGPQSADIDAMRSFQFERDPRIPYAFANARNKLEQGYNSPTGGYTNPQIRDAQIRSGSRGLAQDESQALREENVGFQGMKFGQKAAVAGMTAPRVVQTGGTSSGTGTSTQTQSPGIDSFIQGGASMGSALLL